ncbi:TATA-binding protein-associated factor 2N-like [Zingiber officinale]|uniref:TATA-binding protein-associated factor 2N-like n=1 Tax=Zingiber officinale TaxID=94328 RepID=UPI001C4DA932|nr:TATA-binding protein-associated factor 2N-like [Zingiber officinale]
MNRKPGDWTCRSCQHLNFSRRDSCQRCGDPRPSSERSDHASFGSGGGRAGGGSSFGFAGSDVRPGDWYCSCGAHNFASRSSCFKCAAAKEDSAARSGGGGGVMPDGDMPRSRGYGFGSASGGRAGWKSGDWICNSCNEHNFASRTECFRCSAPRDSGKEEV